MIEWYLSRWKCFWRNIPWGQSYLHIFDLNKQQETQDLKIHLNLIWVRFIVAPDLNLFVQNVELSTSLEMETFVLLH